MCSVQFAVCRDAPDAGDKRNVVSAKGSITYVCTHDGSHSYSEPIPLKPHTDGDRNGYCDVCGKNLADGACRLCNEVHTGFFGKIVGFFHYIFWFLRELFS